MQVSNVFFPVLAFDIARNIVHRARAVEGNDSDKVFKTVRLDLLVNVFHAGRFKLEHRGSIAALQQFVGRAVIQIDIVHIQLNAVHFLTQSQARLITVRVFRPRKSNLISPVSSTYFISYWVTGISDFGSL